MKQTFWFSILLLISLAGRALSEEIGIPCLPPELDLVRARVAMLDPKHRAEDQKHQTTEKYNNWYNKLVLDRIGGTYSKGQGLFIDDSMNGNSTRTVIQTDKSNEAWAVTYTMPLSLIREWAATKDQVRDERVVLNSQHQAERRTEAMNIHLLYNDFLEARALYLACGKSSAPDLSKDLKLEATVDCLSKGYKMRKIAINLLLLTDAGDSESCKVSDWTCFLGDAQCMASPLEEIVLEVQGRSETN